MNTVRFLLVKDKIYFIKSYKFLIVSLFWSNNYTILEGTFYTSSYRGLQDCRDSRWKADFEYIDHSYKGNRFFFFASSLFASQRFTLLKKIDSYLRD